MAEQRRQQLKTITLPQGKFDIILADPPWRYDYSVSRSREIENQYPTLSLDEIKFYQVNGVPIQEKFAENSILFLWATSPKLLEALEAMKAWGFLYRTCAVWDKEIIGMGYYFRQQHELLLVGIRGRFSPPLAENRISSVIKSKRENHSKKPDIIYEMIEKMYPDGKKLELFARGSRTGWAKHGNESA